MMEQEKVDDQQIDQEKQQGQLEKQNIVRRENKQVTNDNIQSLLPQNYEHQKIQNKPKKPTSSYMTFIAEYSKQGHEKITLKQYAQLWNEMSMDEKQIYIKKHQEALEKYNEQIQIYIEQNPEEQNFNLIESEIELAFSVSRIKGILKQDEENKNLSKENVLLICKATELFGQYLAQKSKKNMIQNKRKQLQTQDLVDIIKSENNFSFLQCLFDQEQNEKIESKQQNQKDSNTNQKQEKPKISQSAQVPKNNTTLDQFFKKI